MAFFACGSAPRQRRPPRSPALATVSVFLRAAGEAGACSVICSALAMAGGIFTRAALRTAAARSEPAHRARVIAANNIINALAMTVGRGRRRHALLAAD